MIKTEAGLKQSIELLAGQYRALAALHRDIAPLNVANYQALAEGSVEQIRRLQHEINTYLDVSEAFAPEEHRA